MGYISAKSPATYKKGQNCLEGAYMETEAETLAQLSNIQLLNVLHGLANKVANLEAVIAELIKVVGVQDEFLTNEILKAKLELEQSDRKTPYRRLVELEDSFRGFIVYHEERSSYSGKEQRAKPKSSKPQKLKAIGG